MRLSVLCALLVAVWQLGYVSAAPPAPAGQGRQAGRGVRKEQQQQVVTKLCSTSPVALQEPENYPWRYLVLITQGRSGSTLVQRLINMLPGYFINGENSNVFLELLRIRLRLDKAHNARQREAEGEATESAHLPSMEAMDRHFRSLIDSFLSPKTCEARTVGFKEIRIWLYKQYDEAAMLVEQLLEFEPRTGIVFLTRNTEELITSGWWKSQQPQHARNALNSQRNNFLRFHEAYPNNTYWLTYEDTVGKTDAFFGLFTFLGVDFPEEAYRIATTTNPF